MFEHLNFNFEDIVHKFFNRQCLESTHIYNFKPENNIDEVLANHNYVIKDLNVKSLKVVKQIHSNIVYVVSDENIDVRTVEADALVTNKPNIALGILTADCVPIIFADTKNKIIGAAHAGWKGAMNGIIENTIKAMCELGADLASIDALIGPCIHQESYEVGEEFLSTFLQSDGKNIKYFKPLFIPNKYLFDLRTYVQDKLYDSKINSVYDIGHNTFAMPSLYTSYRRSTITGEPYKGSLLSTILMR